MSEFERSKTMQVERHPDIKAMGTSDGAGAYSVGKPDGKIETTRSRFDDALAALVRQAVEAEKQRFLATVATVFDKGSEQSRDALFASIRNAIDPSTPQSPADEPMTIPKLIEKVRGVAAYDWSRFEEDLTRLVKTQARRDAEVCVRLAEQAKGEDEPHCHACGNAILEAADLQ